MKIWRMMLACILLVPAASAAQASYGSGKNPTFTIEATRLVLNMRVTLTGKPACNSSSRLVADIRTEAGKSFLDILNAAKQAGLSVRAEGTNTCTLLSNAEDLRSLKLSGVPFR
ncbi:MAG: hypothetical protein JNM48_09680 [Rhodospirillales bacterium]|nr:hypothetical protein [Rhodospirillales bacterium]